MKAKLAKTACGKYW